MKRILLFFLLSALTTDVFGSWAEKWHRKEENQATPFLYSDSNIWANIWMGYSFCSLEDIRKSTTAWNNYFAGYGSTSAQADLDGLNMGLEGGWLFDGLNGLSISVENIQVSQTSYSFSTPYTQYTSAIQPSEVSFSLNFYHFIEQNPHDQTYLCIGGGYYLSSVAFNLNQYTNGTLVGSDSGTWGGGVFGGTLGAGARINAGKNFGIQLDARGRYANFTMVTSNYMDQAAKQTYESALVVGTNGLIFQEPMANVGSGNNQDRFLDIDFSGFDLNVGIFYHF